MRREGINILVHMFEDDTYKQMYEVDVVFKTIIFPKTEIRKE